jgi:putative glutamine amidotransferase
MTALIAVTGRVVAAGSIDRWRAPALAVPRPYLDALERAGGRAAVLARSSRPGDCEGDLLVGFDGVLLTGGGDIDPARYGAAPAPEIYGVDAEADAFELGLVHAAISAGLPVLGICRGLQVLNVAFGGTLDQHIVGRPDREDHGRPGGEEVVHSISVEPGSRLAGALGETEVMGSCHHHQAVEQVGRGLRVSARTPDGGVEGLELEGEPWVVAVQWHPEDTAAIDATQQRLFSSFVAAT